MLECYFDSNESNSRKLSNPKETLHAISVLALSRSRKRSREIVHKYVLGVRIAKVSETSEHRFERDN